MSANSPFWRGSYTGLASARTALRGALQRGGLPRRSGSYRAYVARVEALIAAGAIPGPGALEWDARLRPERGGLEVVVMDAQARVTDVIAIAALIQCLVRLHAERERDDPDSLPELLSSNRSAAAEAGMRARLIDLTGEFRQRAMDELMLAIEACAPIARELDCARELAHAARTGADPGRDLPREHRREVGAADAGGVEQRLGNLVVAARRRGERDVGRNAE